MPTYEALLLVKQLPRVSVFTFPFGFRIAQSIVSHNLEKKNSFQPELVKALARAATSIYDRDGIIRKVESLGFRPLPYKISKDQVPYREANRILFTFDLPFVHLRDLKDEYVRNVDIIRKAIHEIKQPVDIECTMYKDMIEPAYREDVQKMLKMSKKKEKKYWLPNTGIDYYPFRNWTVQTIGCV